MKKAIIIILIFGLYAVSNGQDKYMSKTGHVSFYSKTPMEVIEAHNNQVATVINIKEGTIAFNLIQKAFKFERALMEEHFNENYMESSKFPKCTFSGKFKDFDLVNFKNTGSYKVVIEGDMNMHGVTKHIKTNGTIDVKNGKIYGKSKFNIKPEDYGIQIPGIVKDKIASTMEISVDITYVPFK